MRTLPLFYATSIENQVHCLAGQPKVPKTGKSKSKKKNLHSRGGERERFVESSPSISAEQVGKFFTPGDCLAVSTDNTSSNLLAFGTGAQVKAFQFTVQGVSVAVAACMLELEKLVSGAKRVVERENARVAQRAAEAKEAKEREAERVKLAAEALAVELALREKER
jgi:hypothetical protein